ncbi:MAG TPA: hypothetical protein VEU54_03525 [Steroidobacteraceae bacterium]|nr:hypothetical protein [Steroidobacteraceae bacterium]
MRPAPAIAIFWVVLAGLAGCAHEPAAPAAPATAPAGALPSPAATPPAAPAAPVERPTPAPAAAPATAGNAGAAGGPAAASAREAAPRSPPNAPARSRVPAAASGTPAAASAAAATAAPVAAAPAAKPASPALDLAALEQRLRDTRAIGLFTKLSLKNQVDDLLAQFRGYYDGRAPLTLAELRRSYELLLMKVVTLLQDGDPGLATAVSSSREAIWAMLSDRKSFSNL